MTYPYPILDEDGHGVDLAKSIEELATTKSTCPFCHEFQDCYALDFDEIKRTILRERKGELRSVDGFHKSNDGWYVFVEFKQETVLDLRKRGTAQDLYPHMHDGKTRPTIQVLLRQKAIDSLSVAAFTELRNVSMFDIQKNAILIVVHADDKITPSFGKIVKNMRRLSASATNPPQRAILWNLERLKSMGFYNDIFTWSESEFVKYGRGYFA